MKNILIFFDNHTFKLNNIIINNIKRWIIYKIINNYDEYENICVYKTYPEFVEKKIKITNIYENIIDILTYINNIIDILTYINNIIYKKYDKYPKICFKNIFDKINTNKTISYKDIVSKTYDLDEIFIFTSILIFGDEFTQYNIDYINKIINKQKSKINLINIYGVKYFNIIFPQINENIIDINCLKMENIYINEMIGLNNIDTLEELYKYKNFDFTKHFNELEYLKLMYYIENLIIYNLSIGNLSLNTQQLEIINLILNNSKILNIDKHNIQLQNIFKSYKNSIKDILGRQSNLIIKLPINKLSPELSCFYIKYILEFYSIIYPKIYYYNLLYISDKIQKNKQKNISDTTSCIKINNIKNINLEQENISCQYLTSSLTITNWKEEYDNANPFGFLIKFNPTKLLYKGIFDVNSSILKTYPNMIINNITTNFVSLYDYYQIILFDYEKDNDNDNDVDNKIGSEKKCFNISNFNIIDNVNGDGNVLLPLYINKNHWELTKSLWSYHISFINNCFEQEYNIKMDNIYFFVIFKLFNNLKNNNNIKSIIRLFCYVL